MKKSWIRQMIRGVLALSAPAGLVLSLGCQPDLPQMDPDAHRAQIE